MYGDFIRRRFSRDSELLGIKKTITMSVEFNPNIKHIKDTCFIGMREITKQGITNTVLFGLNKEEATQVIEVLEKFIHQAE